MSKKLLIISDSHGYDDLVLKVLKKEDYDVSVFAGDYTTDLSFMKAHFDYFVDGNNDYQYKDVETFKIENIKFVLVHSHQFFSFDKDKYFSRMREFAKEHNADVLIYGHTHYQLIDDEQTPILVDPGSIALPRGPKKKGSYIVCLVDQNKIDFKVKYI